MLEELRGHGYQLSPGTLYPMLARMAARGWLRSSEPMRSKAPRRYRLTARGHEVLEQVRASLDELYGEMRAEHGVARRSDVRDRPVSSEARRIPRSTGGARVTPRRTRS
jgi:DNA-binding PadR family transcriptional regulator